MKTNKLLSVLALAGLVLGTVRIASASTGAVAIDSLKLVAESAPGAMNMGGNHGGGHGGGYGGGHGGGYGGGYGHGGGYYGGYHGGYYGGYSYGGYSYGGYSYGGYCAQKTALTLELASPQIAL